MEPVFITKTNVHFLHAAVYGQKLHPLVAKKIAEMVAAGIVDTAEVKCSLKYYVNNFFSKEIGKTPLEHDRAFHPT